MEIIFMFNKKILKNGSHFWLFLLLTEMKKVFLFIIQEKIKKAVMLQQWMEDYLNASLHKKKAIKQIIQHSGLIYLLIDQIILIH